MRSRAQTGETIPASMRKLGSFEEFFESEHQTLFAALLLITRHRQEAEEIMQDSFLKLWERWDHVRDLENPTGYLYRTAMNGYRSRSRRASVAVRKTISLLPHEDAIARVEARESIIRGLAALTPRQRAAVVLTDLLEFTSEEAARLLGVRSSTIRVLARRGRAQLRLSIGEGHE
jgi:RNA polymerase sigma-70 factor, ECF subfamily